MMNILKKGAVLLGIYVVMVIYLFAVSERFERLDENSNLEKTGVEIKFSNN